MIAFILRLIRWWYHKLKLDKLLHLASEIRTAILVPSIRRNYVLDLNRLRNKFGKQKIRVLFLSSDDTKWKVQSLYQCFEESKEFEPVVALSIYGWHDDLGAAEQRLVKAVTFFRNRGIMVEYAYDRTAHSARALSEFSPDIVFYDQPWDIMPEHDPAVVSKYALTCYVPYMLPSFDLMPIDYFSFHRRLHLEFMLSEGWIDRLTSIKGHRSSAGSLVATGHPMLDIFPKTISSVAKDSYVIYAPHWTFPHPHNPNPLNISTFLWSAKPILAYAQRHREINWAFKPHPALKGALVKSGAMSAEEIDAYYQAWADIGTCCYTGDYPELFLRSRAMITDCASFLTEYACTGHPLIRLVSSSSKVHPSKLSEDLYSTYYTVENIGELEPMLENVVRRMEDPRKSERIRAASKLGLGGTNAAANIFDHICNQLNGRNEV